MLDPDAQRLTATLQASPLISAVFVRWEQIELPACWLAAGAVAQTVWNAAHGRPAAADIRDVDLVYFDPADLSAERERRQEARVRALFADLGVAVDAKNEARVHLWYAEKFGYPIRPYRSVEHAIATFPTTATAIGVRPGASGLELCGPFGLSDLLALVVRPNKAQITRPIYEAKAARWRRCWPLLTILAWNAADEPRP